MMPLSLPSSPGPDEMAAAFYRKDASYDGLFVVAVRTTGIFCRPSCSSCPKPEHIEFFPTLQEAVLAGYRPCQRCRPMELQGEQPAWVQQIMGQLTTDPSLPITASDLNTLGVTPERARRWFQEHYGMSLTAWCRAQRLAQAFAQLHRGESLDQAGFASGYESLSGFREAFTKTFGIPPGQARQGQYVAVQPLTSPLGPMLAGAIDNGITWLEFADRTHLNQRYQQLQKRFRCAVLPVAHPHLEQLQQELVAYFAGQLKAFTVPLHPQGTPFQRRVWEELGRIPYADAIAYDDLARRIGQPTAMRAVAQANGRNPINILIPCHRVVGKDGSLTGYGGGLWRKRLLLRLEQTGKLPGFKRDAVG